MLLPFELLGEDCIGALPFHQELAGCKLSWLGQLIVGSLLGVLAFIQMLFHNGPNMVDSCMHVLDEINNQSLEWRDLLIQCQATSSSP